MLQLHNSTPFSADIAVFPNAQGVDTLYIIVKATFDVGSQLTLSSPQEPLVVQDQYQAETPQHSSLLAASDYHPTKPGTDLIVVGDCLAPEGVPTQSCDVRVDVGPLTKALRVFGDRVWENGTISLLRPFERIPLIYENAFGGTVYGDDGTVVDAYPHNPVGLGFAATRNAMQMHGERLPNLENPAQLIRTVADCPLPVGVGPIASFWPARSCYAGTYDDQWASERAPYLPMDFDSRFFHVASEGLFSRGYLKGGESVQVSNMTAAGLWAFKLPEVALASYVSWRRQTHRIPLALETVVLQPNQSRLTMTWRGALEVNQHALEVESVSVKMLRAESVSAL